MHAALEDVEEYVKRHGLGPERVARLALIAKGCNASCYIVNNSLVPNNRLIPVYSIKPRRQLDPGHHSPPQLYHAFEAPTTKILFLLPPPLCGQPSP